MFPAAARAADIAAWESAAEARLDPLAEAVEEEPLPGLVGPADFVVAALADLAAPVDFVAAAPLDPAAAAGPAAAASLGPAEIAA